MKHIGCADCGRSLINDEIALNLKLRGRSIGRFSCYSCLAQRLDCDDEKLHSMVEYYRENGCELFTQVYVGEPGGITLESMADYR